MLKIIHSALLLTHSPWISPRVYPVVYQWRGIGGTVFLGIVLSRMVTMAEISPESLKCAPVTNQNVVLSVGEARDILRIICRVLHPIKSLLVFVSISSREKHIQQILLFVSHRNWDSKKILKTHIFATRVFLALFSVRCKVAQITRFSVS